MTDFKFLNCILLFLSLSITAVGQEVVFDWQHFQSVSANGAVRSAAEATHNQHLTDISNNINGLNTNIGSVVLVQTLIFRALSNVNSALKNGLEVKNMAAIVADITQYTHQAIDLARSDPYLLLFANELSAAMRARALALVNDVSGFILKEGSNVMADYNSREQLLHKVTEELQILDGLAYGAWKAMYWAKERGIIASLNPFSSYINSDQAVVTQIIQNAKYLRQ